MASKHPTINDAKNLAEKYGKDGVIVLHFGGGRVGFASYGETKRRCDALGKVADQIFDRLRSGEIRVEG